MDGHHIDGTLVGWPDVEKEATWEALLLGNGFSINIWRGFEYPSLYDEADRGTRHGGLKPTDRHLFEDLGTKNFELVLAEIRSAIRMAELVGEDPAPYYERYRSVQAALAAAVRAAHITRIEIPDHSLSIIRDELLRYRAVFTTCYDVIVYWAMGYGGTFEGFCDCFWANGRNEFDPTDVRIRGGRTPVYFAHGALHLIVAGAGTTRKLIRGDQTLLDQFGGPIPGDPTARPLLITEGSSQDKIRAIDNNPYLIHCVDRLRRRPDPLVVFGHGLGAAQDQHLVDAINEHPERPVAVSIRPGSRKAVLARQAHFRGALHTKHLYFFNSETHALGNPKLTKTGRLRGMFRGQSAA